jgi:hypothetical protein
MSADRDVFYGVYRIVLQSGEAEEEFDRLMRSEVIPQVAGISTRVGWIEEQTLLKHGNDIEHEYLWIVRWKQPFSNPTPDSVRTRLEELLPKVPSSLGATVSLEVYLEIGKSPEPESNAT